MKATFVVKDKHLSSRKFRYIKLAAFDLDTLPRVGENIVISGRFFRIIDICTITSVNGIECYYIELRSIQDADVANSYGEGNPIYELIEEASRKLEVL